MLPQAGRRAEAGRRGRPGRREDPSSRAGAGPAPPAAGAATAAASTPIVARKRRANVRGAMNARRARSFIAELTVEVATAHATTAARGILRPISGSGARRTAPGRPRGGAGRPSAGPRCWPPRRRGPVAPGASTGRCRPAVPADVYIPSSPTYRTDGSKLDERELGNGTDRRTSSASSPVRPSRRPASASMKAPEQSEATRAPLRRARRSAPITSGRTSRSPSGLGDGGHHDGVGPSQRLQPVLGAQAEPEIGLERERVAGADADLGARGTPAWPRSMPHTSHGTATSNGARWSNTSTATLWGCSTSRRHGRNLADVRIPPDGLSLVGPGRRGRAAEHRGDQGQTDQTPLRSARTAAGSLSNSPRVPATAAIPPRSPRPRARARSGSSRWRFTAGPRWSGWRALPELASPARSWARLRPRCWGAAGTVVGADRSTRRHGLDHDSGPQDDRAVAAMRVPSSRITSPLGRTLASEPSTAAAHPGTRPCRRAGRSCRRPARWARLEQQPAVPSAWIGPTRPGLPAPMEPAAPAARSVARRKRRG